MMQMEKFKAVLNELKVEYSEHEDYLCGSIVIYPGTIQDSGSTAFHFDMETGKLTYYDTPLVDNCLTRRM